MGDAEPTKGDPQAHHTRDLGILALVILGPVWGYGWVATKIALGYSEAITFAALRVPLSAACLFLVMIVLRRSLRPPPLGYTIVIGLLQTTFFVGLVITALHSAGAGKVSVLTYTMPFWLLVLAWLFLGERLRGLQWLAVGIAFAPPHQISEPRKSPAGTVIAPSPPRTGMPSGIMGKLAATNIAETIKSGTPASMHTASMADMGAACVASAGSGLRHGSAASMTMYPVVPDLAKYPGTGRSLDDTFGEIGLAGHWIKLLLHYMFIYKAKARPGWWLIPE